MKRNTAYSLVVFLLVACYVLSGMSIQLVMGVVKWNDVPLILGLALFAGTLVGVIFFNLAKLTERLGFREKNSLPYAPGRVFAVVSVVLIAIGSAGGAIQSYAVGSEQRAAAEKQRQAEERLKLAAEKAAEAERQRVASLTPEQRAAEEKQKRVKAEAAAKAVAAEAARKEAEKAKVAAEKKKRDAQLQLAGAGALMLKRAMKDPQAFELTSLVVKPTGTACYEYRAKNSFGAILPSSAVLTSAGKMLLQERDGNSFVSVWNKNCTVSGGDEIATLVNRLILQ